MIKHSIILESAVERHAECAHPLDEFEKQAHLFSHPSLNDAS